MLVLYFNEYVDISLTLCLILSFVSLIAARTTVKMFRFFWVKKCHTARTSENKSCTKINLFDNVNNNIDTHEHAKLK